MEQQNTQGATPETSTPFPQNGAGENKSSLMLVGACAVVLALVLLSWYMMKQSQTEVMVPAMETTTTEQTAANEAASADAAVKAMETQGSSDEITAIEADVTASDFSSLDNTSQI